MLVLVQTTATEKTKEDTQRVENDSQNLIFLSNTTANLDCPVLGKIAKVVQIPGDQIHLVRPMTYS